MLIFVFDPLAVVLVIAFNMTMGYREYEIYKPESKLSIKEPSMEALHNTSIPTDTKVKSNPDTHKPRDAVRPIKKF